MKIGIFTDAYNPSVSGVVTAINMIEQEMQKRGHEVYIFAPSKSIQPNENDTLYMIKSLPLIFARQYKNRFAFFYSREVAKKVKELNLDIIHTQSEFSIGHFGKILSRKFNIPFMHTYHTMWEDYIHYVIPIESIRNHMHIKEIARTYSRNFCRRAKCIIAPSDETRGYLENECKIKNKPVYVLPTGIDTKFFAKENIEKEQTLKIKKDLGINEQDKVILFLGRVGEEKSIDVLLNEISKLLVKNDKVKFVIVGDGPSKDDLQNLAQKLNVDKSVKFTGKVDWKDVPKYYSIADVFVNASLTETQGLTFLEAMAAGVPIVARYAPNLTEIIKSETNGILVKDSKDFVENIEKVLYNNDIKNQLIQEGLKTANEYSVEKFAEKLEEIYTSVIQEKKS